MISSSYFPPASTPQRDRDNSVVTGNSSGSSIKSTTSPSTADFKTMPVNEMLSSANSRSAFLQSLQRSREREERREKDLQREREKDQGYGPTAYGASIKESSAYEMNSKGLSAYESNTKGSSAHAYGPNTYGSGAYDTTSYGSSATVGSSKTDSYNDAYNNTLIKDPYSYSSTQSKDPYSSKDSYCSTANKDPYSSTTNKDSYSSNANKDNYSSSATSKDNYTSYNNYAYESKTFNTANTTNTINTQADQLIDGTPIMSRRRLSSPKSSPKSTPLKPPASQSKLASHAFTMSRSSTEEEVGGDYQREIDFKDQRERSFNASSDVLDFKSKYEQEFSKPAVSMSVPSNNTTTDLDLRGLIESVIEPQTASLKSDLQNLHIELIKQSVAQQSAFRSLLETYLPLTGKLMETLRETREENDRLKMRIEELSQRRF